MASHRAAEARKIPEQHTLPQHIGRIDQGQLIVLKQMIRRRVIVVNLPDAHFRSKENFKRRLQHPLFADYDKDGFPAMALQVRFTVIKATAHSST